MHLDLYLQQELTFKFLYNIVSTSMAASADKVQHLLENCLQQSLSLVRRGIFSQTELQSIMLNREKQQHSMLKIQYKLTDYMHAIQYQYELQRQRRARMTEMSKLQEGTNPLFKKQSSADFAIVKRIVRLWDRTMHKYKFQTKLWKQYLSFTLAIGSKKHFYKALTNALRFQPFDVDLWKIGAAYELQQGKNLWKGRKILIKGMKMVPSGLRNIQLAQFMIDYEITFLRTLLQRREILVRGQQGMRMIGQEEQQQSQMEQILNVPQADTINLEEFDRVIWLVVQQALTKNTNIESNELNFSKIKERIYLKLKTLQDQQLRQDVKQIIAKVIDKLNQYNAVKAQQISFSLSHPLPKIEQKSKKNQSYSNNEILDNVKQKIAQNGSNIDWQEIKRHLKTFCLKPHIIAEILNYLLQANPNKTLAFIYQKYSKTKLPVLTLHKMIEIYFSDSILALKTFISGKIDKWVSNEDLHQNRELLQKVIEFNVREDRLKSNATIQRSLSIVYKNQPQFLQECARLSQKY